MQITVSPRTTEMVGERTGIVGFLGVDITKVWMPGAVSNEYRVQEPYISSETHDMEIVTSSCTTDIGERTRIVRFLRVDIAKEGIPGAISKTDGVPEPPIACKANEVQIASNTSTPDGGE